MSDDELINMIISKDRETRKLGFDLIGKECSRKFYNKLFDKTSTYKFEHLFVNCNDYNILWVSQITSKNLNRYNIYKIDIKER